MPASLAISHLSYSGPDGRRLFSDLNLSFGPGRTGLVGRNGVGKTTLLRLITGELQPTSGTIAVAGRIGVLRQQVQPGPDETVADIFGVRAALALLQRAASGAASADEMADADWTLEARLEDALDRLDLGLTPDSLLATLSGGQRTRVALAALRFDAPDLVLLDEPTNNLDAEGRAAVADMLGGWRGAAIVISHDRTLLDQMDAIVELTTLGATSYGGNYSHYRERKALELASAQHDLDVAERSVRAAARAAQEARERQDRRDAGGRRKAARGDMPKIVMGGKKRQAEETAAGFNRLAAKEAEEARDDAQAARSRLEVLTPFAVKLASSGLHAGKVVLRARGLTGGHDRDKPAIRDVDLELIGPERVAISGRNGTGKTTLLKLLFGELEPLAGTVLLRGPMAMLDQQVGMLDRSLSILDNFRRINPDSTINDCRAVLAAFKFRNEAALQSVGTLSGGEMLRAGLACVLGGTVPPMLVVLDEPTNHLDIEAIEVVEAGLRAYDGALLVVSHDRTFLDNIGIEREVELTPP